MRALFISAAATRPAVAGAGLTNPAAGDFTLAARSPLLNQGSPSTRPAVGNFALDCAGLPRLAGGRYDLGAYENQTALANFLRPDPLPAHFTPTPPPRSYG